VDDLLIHGPDEAAVLATFRQVLERCREHNLTLKESKVEYGDNVKFAGFVITKDGVKPDPDRLAAVAEFPVPTDVSTVRGFMGLVNQLGIFHPDIAHMSELLRQLLKKEVSFQWLPEHDEAFRAIKAYLTSDAIVKPYDPKLPTEVLTDASRLKGIGYALIQRGRQNEMRLIQCGSRSLASAETRYATNELECMAIQYAISSCKHYLLGSPRFLVVTDHRPLEGTFKKPLSEIQNVRMLRYREKLVDYVFDVTWQPGKNHQIADALSRAPVFDAPEVSDNSDDHIADVFTVSVNTVVAADPLLQELSEFAAADEEYQQVLEALRQNKNVNELHPAHPAKCFRNVWNDLSSSKVYNVFMYHGRLVVPKLYRPSVLKNLHLPHAGIVRTKQLARDAFYWNGMGKDIEDLVSTCEQCQVLRPSLPAEPLQLYPPAARPMQQVSSDLFEEKGKHYIVLVDRFSGYTWVKLLRSLATAAITRVLDGWFLEFGYPRHCLTDGGPQFRSEFTTYCTDNFITHSISSAHFHQSNGLAESAVKNMKYLMKKSENQEDFQRALLQWRNMPRANHQKSPAELFLGRAQRRPLPDLRLAEALEPAIEVEGLEPLPLGGAVRIQDEKTKRWTQKGVILARREHGRSYEVQREDGYTLLRNRRFLRVLKMNEKTSEESSDECTENRHCDNLHGHEAESELSALHSPKLRRSDRLSAKAAEDSTKDSIAPTPKPQAPKNGRKKQHRNHRRESPD
jgi:hypothetical protein